MKTLSHIALTGTPLFLPALVYAAATDIFGVAAVARSLLSSLASMLAVLAVMLFFWGVVKFIANSSDAKQHEEGKKFIVWGLVSLLIIFSIWAIVGLILGEFGITATPVPFTNSGG